MVNAADASKLCGKGGGATERFWHHRASFALRRQTLDSGGSAREVFSNAWPDRSLRNPYKNNVVLMEEGHHLTRPMRAVSASQLDTLRKLMGATLDEHFDVALDFLKGQYWLKKIIWDTSFQPISVYAYI